MYLYYEKDEKNEIVEKYQCMNEDCVDFDSPLWKGTRIRNQIKIGDYTIKKEAKNCFIVECNSEKYQVSEFVLEDKLDQLWDVMSTS